MPILVLDLDLTVFVTERDADFLHEAHYDDLSITLTAHSAYLGDLYEQHFRLINLSHLSRLIETACNKYQSDILILTSGCWEERSVKTILMDQLYISDETRKKIENCQFLSLNSCTSRFPTLTLPELSQLAKNKRLNKFVEHHPDFANRHKVVLDNHPDHLDSFKDEENVTAIHATTDTEDKSFYDKAIEAIKNAWLKENAVTLKDEPSVLRSTSISESNTSTPRRSERLRNKEMQRLNLHPLFPTKKRCLPDNEPNKENRPLKRMRVSINY